jgi:leucyl aminopeptidase
VRITAGTGRVERVIADVCALGVHEDGGSLQKRVPLKGAPARRLAALLRSVNFSARSGEVLVIPSQGIVRSTWIAVCGLGKSRELKPSCIRQMGGVVVSAAQKHQLGRMTILLPTSIHGSSEVCAQALAEGCYLEDYRFLTYKQIKPAEKFHVKHVSVVPSAPAVRRDVARGIRLATTITSSTLLVRDMCNQPANVATPTYLKEQAKRVARQHKMSFTAYSTKELKRMKMGGILSVSQGSVEPPHMVIMEYNKSAKKVPTVVLVGKGVTFDSGGISIKPSRNMDEMKFDMCGAAAVIGCLRMVGDLQLPFHVVGIFAAAENMPSGSATRPGDIITTYSGKTVEVLNTDAEGRMILSDCLHYAKKFKPDAVIDFATLTGACVVALGRFATGMMGTDETLIGRLKAAGDASGERVWELPLWPEHTHDMRGPITDLRNISGRGEAGTTTAGAFLKEFTDYPWVHLDIAGTAWTTHPTVTSPHGSTGVGVRLIAQLLRTWADGA